MSGPEASATLALALRLLALGDAETVALTGPEARRLVGLISPTALAELARGIPNLGERS